MLPNLDRAHLGCGAEYLSGYINVDTRTDCKTDILGDIKDVGRLFPKNSLSEILMIHSIAYLNLWEARVFFKQAHSTLKPNGILVIETPDIFKCAWALIKYRIKHSLAGYLEAVRAFYAFDMGQIERKEDFFTYSFGWSAWHLKQELLAAGFSQVKILSPQTHRRRKWRDIRIEAKK